MGNLLRKDANTEQAPKFDACGVIHGTIYFSITTIPDQQAS